MVAAAGPGRGTLFLVVGPSGAGKDTLIDAARAALVDNPRYLFARRVVTRPADAGGEAHEEVSEAEFAALAAVAGFALSWSAHGLNYGVRRDIVDWLAAGRHAVVNVSRAVVATTRVRLAPVVVIEVNAHREVLAQRLAARGRESAADIAKRLARASAVTLDGDVRRVDNSGDLADAVAAFIAALRP
jgi:phosphonate metabolism protein PhnN/1,5-bisphosphokinase (PRPP-forming)